MAKERGVRRRMGENPHTDKMRRYRQMLKRGYRRARESRDPNEEYCGDPPETENPRRNYRRPMGDARRCDIGSRCVTEEVAQNPTGYFKGWRKRKALRKANPYRVFCAEAWKASRQRHGLGYNEFVKTHSNLLRDQYNMRNLCKDDQQWESHNAHVASCRYEGRDLGRNGI
jgi:hypothetical protein